MKFFLLLWFVLIEQFISQNIRSIDMSMMNGWKFQCVTTTCLPFVTVIVSDIFDCRITCLVQFHCNAASFHQSTSKCDLFGDLSNQNGNMLIDLDVTTMIVSTGMRTPPASQGNWVINGDAETGPCESGGGVTSPTGWSYSGTITQAYYDNYYADLYSTSPGPSDRGNCHFYGQISSVTSMWQIVNIVSFINPLLIDNQTVWFNLSAWIGGYSTQEDNAEVSLSFLDQTNQTLGNSTILGPIWAEDRDNITSLIFRQASGLVPIGACTFKILVTMTRSEGSYNDGNVDNIILLMYQ